QSSISWRGSLSAHSGNQTPRDYLVFTAGGNFPRFRYLARHVFKKPIADANLAPQHHPFLDLSTDLDAASGHPHLSSCEMAKMEFPFVPGALRNLGRRDSQPHFSRSGHDVWHDDLVTTRMVAPGVGHSLHC